MLTKGDNNHVDDIDLYQGLEWLDRRHIIGKVRGYVLFPSCLTVKPCSLTRLPSIYSFHSQVPSVHWLRDDCHGKPLFPSQLNTRVPIGNADHVTERFPATQIRASRRSRVTGYHSTGVEFPEEMAFMQIHVAFFM
jgi:hypothetical protein